jgi:ribonuclease P protein component
MFSKEFRIRKKEEVNLIFKTGKSVSFPELAFRFLPNKFPHTRVTVLVGTKLSNKAAHRNRIKRRLREIARQNHEELPKGIDLLVVARSLKLREMDFVQLTNLFLSLAKKITNH